MDRRRNWRKSQFYKEIKKTNKKGYSIIPLEIITTNDYTIH